MPTYRYQGPRDTEPHVVVADSYEREGETFLHPSPEGAIVTFLHPSTFDGVPYASSVFSLSVISPDDPEIIPD